MHYTLDNDPPQLLSTLPWTGDGVFPGGELFAEVLPNTTLYLRSFAPLSPFETLQGFIPALLASFSLVSTQSHTLRLSYTFVCTGDWQSCMGGSSSSVGTKDSPCQGIGGGCGYSASGEVFLGAVGGESNVSTACPPSLIPPPPASDFHLVANDSVADGKDCTFLGWGCGGPSSCSSLQQCEVACGEDPACTTLNFGAGNGDCVFRKCSDPATPSTRAYPGYAVYTSTTPKPPRPTLCVSSILSTPSATTASATTSSTTLIWGLWDGMGNYAPSYPTPPTLFAYLATHTSALAAQHSAFVAALPTTGGADAAAAAAAASSSPAGFDASIRWLMAPAVLLTKGVGGNVSTMGYVEMCPRDSYHTTWLHAYLWPELERVMLLEMCAAQCSPHIPACNGTDGKIPTTILPFIYRPDNIDVTAYFVLRVGRYFEVSGDVGLLETTWPCLQRALAYLLSRDTQGDGLPAALPYTFWGDWLDVDYMQGRQYTPHTAFTFLGALAVGEGVAGVLGEGGGAGVVYREAFDKGALAVERLLWDGGNGGGGGGVYRDTWWPGARPPRYPPTYTLMDQTVALFLGLPLPPGRTPELLAGLAASGGVKTYGVVDIFPYLPKVDDPPAVYGNGGNYPWLTCMHAVSLCEAGDREGGLALFSSMANQMLFNASQPTVGGAWEYMQGDTGADMGAFPHGETAACFAVASRGATQWRRVGVWDRRLGGGAHSASSSNTYSLHVHSRGVYVRPLHGMNQPLGGGDGKAVHFLEVEVLEEEEGGGVNARVLGGAGERYEAAGSGWGPRTHVWEMVEGLACDSTTPTPTTTSSNTGGALGEVREETYIIVCRETLSGEVWLNVKVQYSK